LLEQMAIRKDIKTSPEVSWAYMACVYNSLQEKKMEQCHF